MTEEFHAAGSKTTNMSLGEVITRLASSPKVEGVLFMGTTGTSAMTPTSDYDLLLVLSREDSRLRMVTTWIDDRLSEVYCTTLRTIERIARHPAPWPDLSEEGSVPRWLLSGRIAHDRSGRLGRLQAIAAEAPTPLLSLEQDIYEAWRKIGYNVAHLQRYLASDDPHSQLAVDLRLLYSVDEVKAHYFTVRRLPWRGEKLAIHYWTENDPVYRDRLGQFFAEIDRRKRVEIYVDLARLTLAPVGGLWESGSTIVAVGAPYGSDEESWLTATTNDALKFWHRLVDVEP